MMDFGERLKEARKDRGMSQDELAKAVGVSRRVIHSYESGKTRPRDFAKYQEMANVLGVSPDSLIKMGCCQYSPVGIDYKDVIQYSLSSEGLAETFITIFAWMSEVAGEQLADVDREGIERLHEAIALHQEQQSIEMKLHDLINSITSLEDD